MRYLIIVQTVCLIKPANVLLIDNTTRYLFLSIATSKRKASNVRTLFSRPSLPSASFVLHDCKNSNICMVNFAENFLEIQGPNIRYSVQSSESKVSLRSGPVTKIPIWSALTMICESDYNSHNQQNSKITSKLCWREEICVC